MTTHRRSKALVALAIAALSATACGGTGGTGGADGGGPPVQGGSLTFATDIDPGCVDPQQSPLAATLVITRGVLDSLVFQDQASGEIKPWLAESWEVSEDVTTYTFTLRDGVTFSDGGVVDAAAVKANLDRIADPASKSLSGAGLLTGYAGATVRDARTVVVRFDRPNAPFLQAASTATLGIQSPAALAAGSQSTCQLIVGSGPFVMRSYTRQQSVVLAKRPEYRWAPQAVGYQGPAYLDQITISFVAENGVRLGSLRSGQVDTVANVPPRDAESLGGGGAFQLFTKEQPGLAYSLFVNPRRGPWSDLRLRQAIGKSVDTEQIVSTLYRGSYVRATGPLTPTTPAHLALLERDPHDRPGAEALFGQAGWVKDGSGYLVKDGQRLSLTWTYPTPVKEQRDVLAQLVQQQLKEVGVEVVLNPLSTADVIARQSRGEWDLSDLNIVRADGDLLRLFVQPSVPGGVPFMADAELEASIALGARNRDPQQRVAAYQQAQRRLVDQALIVPVYNPRSIIGASNAVHGLDFDAQGLPWFFKTWVRR